jgi:prepilin-type N-terminal cleavage/methylation domain-containing protein
MNKYMEKRNEKGFTLIELLIAIVVVGILAAVAIVGIGGLTNTGGKSACKASADAAGAAAAAFYANQTQNAYPTDFSQMTVDSATAPVNHPPVFVLQPGVQVDTGNAKELDGNGWHLIGTFSTANPPDFTLTGTTNGCQP